MDKRKRKFMIILSTWFFILYASMEVMAAGNVTYSGEAKKFVFEPGSERSPSDLFSSLKGVMPGDSITQKIHIKNDVKNDVKVKLYLKSTGAKEESKEFLSKLRLRVAQKDNSKLFDALADETAQLTEWVCLGTFYSGAEIDLNVTLEVPLELGDEYQEAVGYIDWQFKAEEFPIEQGDPRPPITGDTQNFLIYAFLICLSILIVCFRIPRKTRMNCTDKNNTGL